MSEVADNDKAPTVVLVHGAFADGSSWNGVIKRLQAEGGRGHGARESAAWGLDRLRLHRRRLRGDARAGSRRRALLRRGR